MERGKAIDALVAAVNKSVGGEMARFGVVPPPLQRMTTGSIAVDAIMGGGLAVGKVNKVAGAESSGKTTNSWRAIGLAQRRCANCHRPVADYEVVETAHGKWGATGTCDCFSLGDYTAMTRHGESKAEFDLRVERYKDTGNSYEPMQVCLLDAEDDLVVHTDWAIKVGLDPRRLLHVIPATGEECLDVYKALLASGMIDVFMLDSLPALQPAAEVNKLASEDTMMLQPKLITEIVRMTIGESARVFRNFGVRPTHIWLNQYMSDKDAKGQYAKKYKEKGGWAALYLPPVSLEMWSSGVEEVLIDEELGLAKGDAVSVAARQWMHVKVRKNKTGPSGGHTKFAMDVRGEGAGQVDEWKLIFALGDRLGVIQKAKGSWYLGKDDTILGFAERSFKTKHELAEFLATDVMAMERVRLTLLDSMVRQVLIAEGRKRQKG